ncbi:chemotaxis protein CheD [Desulfogranum japonicum]|uniref:chemotaxis protein CheD n=1 Tax=Desulfogranum japonicum TaxID=231447 RepID=UPI0004251F5B|nr:chemotaxis protein CheD [Desulfogranum japonicum]
MADTLGSSHYPRCQEIPAEKAVYLLPGDYHFATSPTLIHTVLGSCISVVLFDPKTRYGAMCHAVFDTTGRSTKVHDCMKYIDCAMERMFEDFLVHRIKPAHLTVKLFGGAAMINSRTVASDLIQPGAKNVSLARKLLHEKGCVVTSEDCGGSEGRKIFFCSHTGDIFLKKIRRVRRL